MCKQDVGVELCTFCGCNKLGKQSLTGTPKVVERTFKVITLCGSTKFKEDFENINEKLTMEGNIVISVGVFGHAKGITLTEEEKTELDAIHFSKIDLADEIFVINVGGYIGTSTSREIEYAKSTGKRVNYLEEPQK